MAIVNEQLRKYVEENDIEGVKSTLTGMGYFGDTKSFYEFKTSTEYALERITDLFDDDDGQEVVIEYSLSGYKKVAKMMMNNFSEKKYNAAIEIGLKVFETSNNGGEKEEKINGGNPLAEALKNPMKIVIALLVVIAVVLLIVNLI